MSSDHYYFNLGFRPKVTAMGTGWQSIISARPPQEPPNLETLNTLYPLQMALSEGDESRFFKRRLPRCSKFSFRVSQLGRLEDNQAIESMTLYVGASKKDDEVYGNYWRTPPAHNIEAAQDPEEADYYVKVRDGSKWMYYLRFLNGPYMQTLHEAPAAYPNAKPNWFIGLRSSALEFALVSIWNRYEIDFRLDVEFKDTSTGRCYTKIYIGDPEMTVGSGSNPTR